MKMRYEEYAHAGDGVPFVLYEDVTRTPLLYSTKQNWHENIEIQFCTAGQGALLIDGRQYDFQKNDVALIDSGAIHYTYSDSLLTYSCIIVETDFCKQMGIDYGNLVFEPIVKSRVLAELFSQICEVYHANDALRLARLHQLLLEMLIEMLRNHATKQNAKGVSGKGLSAVKKAIVYMREHFDEKMTLDKIAKFSLMDKYNLCKVFKAFTGQTVFEYLNRFRCMMAAEYLADGKSVSEAAYLCGFENHSFFTKTFKKYMGDLPSRYVGMR